MRSSAVSSYHQVQEAQEEKKREGRNITMTVNIESNEYSKAACKDYAV